MQQLQFLVLLPHFRFLFAEHLGLGFQFLVGDAQLLLLGLQGLLRGTQGLGLRFQLFVDRFQFFLLLLEARFGGGQLHGLLFQVLIDLGHLFFLRFQRARLLLGLLQHLLKS